MNLSAIIISVSIVFFIIGVHQSFYYGIQASYWAFMISGGLFLWFQYRKKPGTDNHGAEQANLKRSRGLDKPQKRLVKKRKKG